MYIFKNVLNDGFTPHRFCFTSIATYCLTYMDIKVKV